MKNGICFAGGGIKGVAHIGAIKALEEENIKFDYVAGTSSGSIIACLYAIGYKPEEMYELFKKYSQKINYFSFSKIVHLIFGLILEGKIKVDGLNSGKNIEKYINKVCRERGIYDIRDIRKKLVIPAVNLDNGEVICFTNSEFRQEISDKIIFDNEGNIGKIIRSSCSFPFIFSPCEYKNMKLVDGGIRENVAWKELKKIGAERVISFLFETYGKEGEDNIIDVAIKSFDLMSRELANYEVKGSGLKIKYKSRKIGLLDKTQIPYMYQLGYNETKKNIIKIKKYIEKKTH